MRVYNLDHINTLPGGVGQPHDRAMVVSETEKHIITGESQPKVLFRGTLEDANKFKRGETN